LSRFLSIGQIRFEEARMTPTLLVLSLLSQTEAPPVAEGAAASTRSSFARWHYMTRLETTGLALAPGGGVGREDYAQLTPTLAVDGGAEFGLNLGAPVRFRLGEGLTGRVRPEDWDTLSDWGQLVVRPGFELHALAGWGGRPGVDGAWGAVAGVGADALTPTLDGTLRPGAFASLGLGVDHAR
jgi:hypothetical protein